VIVQAELSLYPLEAGDLGAPIERFCSELRACGVEVQTGAMSSIARGECDELLRAVARALESVGGACRFAVCCKISNACPVAQQKTHIRMEDNQS